MGSKLNRPTSTWVGKLTSSAETTPAISLRDGYSAGKIYLPAAYASSSLSFYSLDPSTGDYVQEYDSAQNPISLAIAAETAVLLPDSLFASTHIKIVTSDDDSLLDVGIVIRV